MVVVGREEVVSIWTEPDSNSNRCGKHLITWSRNASVTRNGRLRSLSGILRPVHAPSPQVSRAPRLRACLTLNSKYGGACFAVFVLSRA